MILFVRLEMLREQRDPLTQQGNLHFWRPRVGLVALISGKYLPFCFDRQCHSWSTAPCLLLSRFVTFFSITQLPALAGARNRAATAKRGRDQRERSEGSNGCGQVLMPTAPGRSRLRLVWSRLISFHEPAVTSAGAPEWLG